MQRRSLVVRFMTETLNFWTQLRRDILHVMIMINRANIYSYKTERCPHTILRIIFSTYLGILIHLVFWSWLVMAFSNSSSPPPFFSFFTKLLTAFSDHLSSFSFSPFFQPRSLLTTGGVKGIKEVIFLSDCRPNLAWGILVAL